MRTHLVGLFPTICRLLDAGEAELNQAGDGSARILVRGFESADHTAEPWMVRAPRYHVHGGPPSASRLANGRKKIDAMKGTSVRPLLAIRVGSGQVSGTAALDR